MRLVAGCAGLALLFAGLAPSLQADATLRYHTDIQTAPLIPAAALDQALGGMRDMVIRIKGNKAYSSQGNLTSIIDFATEDIILVDAAHKRFASVPVSQYAQQAKAVIPAMPEQARSVLASMKSNLESRSTGRTAAIQGVQTEEHEFVLTIDLPLPGGPAAGSPFMKMVMQVWTAQPEEAQRVAALRELKNYRTSAGSALNPAEMIKEVLNGLPGMGDNLSTMIAEMSKDGGVSMRMHVELFAPVLALLSQQLPQPPGQAPGPALDPNAALMQINQEVVELSTGPLDDALFEVPADYQPASLEEILKEAVPPPTTPRFPQ